MCQSTCPTPEDSTQFEAVIKQFEQAWKHHGPVDLDAFLPEQEPLRTHVLKELVHIDLEFRLRRGDSARVEEYLVRYPVLEQDTNAVLELIAAEFTLRRRWQPGAWPEEFLLRFPQFLAELPERLAASEIDENQTIRPGSRSVAAPIADQLPQIPGYEVLGELGHGGMGVVYKAKQLCLDRIVALKMLRLGIAASPDDLTRFRREAQAIAYLDHPNIVPVYEVGTHHGVPYFSMQYFPGGSLAESTSTARADLLLCARQVEVVARAIHHAHERGILHRDLKPSNILLDETGQPHVADFGLAKRLDRKASTRSGALGTPCYMAPEQFQYASEVTVATDVYGVGTVLYELITGRPPYVGEDVHAILRQVAETTPDPPRKYNSQIPADLETICLKCLEKEPRQRYQSAIELAKDLHRWQAGEPIRARPPKPWERASRWVRRHPALAAMGMVCTLATVLVIITLAITNVRIGEEQRKTKLALEHEQKTRVELERSLYHSRIKLAEYCWQANQIYRAVDLLAGCPSNLRHWEWHYLSRQCKPDVITLSGQEGFITGLAFDPTGKRIISGDLQGTIIVWDVNNRQIIHTISGHQSKVLDLAVSADGRRVFATDGTGIVVYDLETAEKLHHFAGSKWLALSPDGRLLATAVGNDVRIWNVENRETWCEFKSGLASAGAFSPDGNRFAAIVEHSHVNVWDLRTKEKVDIPDFLHPNRANSIVFTPDGLQLIIGSAKEIVVANATNGTINSRISTGPRQSAALCISPDGRSVAYAAQDATVRVQSLSNPEECRKLRGHEFIVNKLAFSPDGQNLASAGGDRVVRIWDLRQNWEITTLSRFKPQSVTRLSFSRNGRLAAAAFRLSTTEEGEPEKSICIFDAESGTELCRLPGANGVAFSADDSLVATGSGTGIVSVWNLASNQMEHKLRCHQGDCSVIGFNEDGTRLVTAGEDKTIGIWALPSGKIIHQLNVPTDWVNGAAMTPDGKLLAARTDNAQIGLWDVSTGQKLQTINLDYPVRAVALSADGKFVACAGIERVISMCDTVSGTLIRQFHGHTDLIWGIAFSPDSKRLVSAGEDKVVRIWDVESGQELLSLPDVHGNFTRVAFSWNGRWLAAADSHVRIWDAGQFQINPQ